jgi:predicted GNAT family acetyltransferase
MSTRVEDVADRSRLELFEGSDRVGWLKYQRAQDVLVLEHTEVDRSHEGHGYGGQLVRSALDLAKAEGRRVIVVCPYAKAGCSGTVTTPTWTTPETGRVRTRNARCIAARLVPLDHPAGVPASADLETVYIGYGSADLFDHFNEPLAHLSSHCSGVRIRRTARVRAI